MKTLLKSIPPAIYLACSWCWVIGMLLPVLQVQDWGFWGWLAFAVPNVVGAASVGWVLSGRRGRTAREVVAKHRRYFAVYTAWTIVFHIAVLVLLGSPSLLYVFAAVCLAVFMGGRYPGTLAITVYIFSLIVCSYSFQGFGLYEFPALSGNRPVWELAASAFPLFFGFLLCPYGDISLVKTSQVEAAQSRSKLVFTTGFGVFFLILIVMSLLYAPYIAQHGVASIRGGFGDTEGFAITDHLMDQAAFTIGAHLAASFVIFGKFFAGNRPKNENSTDWKLLLPIGVLLGIWWFDMEGGPLRLSEDAFWFIYRFFLSAYALPFPAYVFICMIPWVWTSNWGASNGEPASVKYRLVVFAIATLIAMPFLGIGYLGDRYELLPIAVLIPLCAPFVCGAKVKIDRKPDLKA